MIELDFSQPAVKKYVDIVQYGDGDMIDEDNIGLIDVTGVDPESYDLKDADDLYYFLVAKFDESAAWWRTLVDNILDVTDYYETYRNIGISYDTREALRTSHSGAVVIMAVGDNVETGESEDFAIAYFALE